MRYRNLFRADHLPATAAVLAMLAAVAVAHGQMGPDQGPPGGGPLDGGHLDGGHLDGGHLDGGHLGGGPPGGGFGGGPGGSDAGGPGGDGGPFGGPPPRMMHHHRPTTGPAEIASPVSGTVQAYNRDPRGRINGIVVQVGDHVVQLNAPPDWAGSLETAAPLKDAISATAVPEVVAGDRTIDRLVTLSGHGVTLTAGGPGEARHAHVAGVVAQLNYSPRGEVDGALLDTGDFIHVGPPAAAELNLATGQKLSVEGRAMPTPDDHQAVEAETVNGTQIVRPPHPRQEAEDGPGMRRPGGGEGGRPGPGGGFGRGPSGPSGQGPEAGGRPDDPDDGGPGLGDALMPPS